jgi:hypothetical protein
MLLALALFALVAGMGAVLTLHAGQLVQADRLRSLDVELRQMIDSGAAYVRLHRGNLASSDEVVVLNATDLCGGQRTAQLTLKPSAGAAQSAGTVVVTARITLPRGKARVMTARVPL